MTSILFAAVMLAACPGPSSAQPQWPTSSPAAQGVSPRHLAQFLTQCQEEKLPLHAFLVVRGGALIHETYAFPFRAGSRHDVASCTKTVTAILAGVAIDQGHLSGTQATLAELFPGVPIENLDDRKRAMTLHDLLTMRSGQFSLSDGLTLLQMQKSPDWRQFALNLRMSRQPGQTFQYLSTNSHLIASALDSAIELPTDQFARRHLFEPVGITTAAWPTDPAGRVHGWGDLRLQPTDMARLGLLLLNRGKYQGQQVVSDQWVRRLTEPKCETGHAVYPRYGLQCWIADDAFAAVGRGGQRIIVSPQRDLVLVTAAGANEQQAAILDRLCFDFLRSVDPTAKTVSDDPEAALDISACQQALAAPPPRRETSVRPEVAARIAGATYRLAPSLIVDRLSVDFPKDDEALLELHFQADLQSGPVVLRVGLDGVPRFSPGRYGETAAATGSWVDPTTFRLDLDEVGNINHWTIELTFAGDKLRFTMRDATGLPPGRGDGVRQP